ncbi:hypothetical protein EVAR_103751_1 [Eumeta japonica]|uniref:Uncharacterized protein n=1 Tax=Eumeta variegata TaxID=151549 RepID=A0A4C1ZPC4_EUMVA|nr:hypothetical protein EVAR_103751_1 [Eumeta japonica]
MEPVGGHKTSVIEEDMPKSGSLAGRWSQELSDNFYDVGSPNSRSGNDHLRMQHHPVRPALPPCLSGLVRPVVAGPVAEVVVPSAPIAPSILYDNTVSNNLANVMQLLVVSNLLDGALPSCGVVPPPRSTAAASYRRPAACTAVVGGCGTTVVY